MKILICDGLAAKAVDQLQSAGHDVDLRKGIDKNELLQAIADIDAVVVRSATKITADVIDRATNLRLVVRGGVGLDNVDRDAARQRGIAVHNTPSATSISVAEYAIALMLSLARHIPQANASVKHGEWHRKAFAGSELHDKTLGLIGFGRIGQEVAKRAKAFGMRVIAFDLQMNREIAEVLEIETLDDLSTLLSRADYLSLHVPLTEQTRSFINAETIAKMKRGARLVNTARGDLLDDAAVAHAITNGHMAGAAIDVYTSEPPATDHPLLALPQVLTLPHLGGSTGEGQTRAGLEVARIICEFGTKN